MVLLAMHLREGTLGWAMSYSGPWDRSLLQTCPKVWTNSNQGYNYFRSPERWHAVKCHNLHKFLFFTRSQSEKMVIRRKFQKILGWCQLLSSWIITGLVQCDVAIKTPIFIYTPAPVIFWFYLLIFCYHPQITGCLTPLNFKRRIIPSILATRWNVHDNEATIINASTTSWISLQRSNPLECYTGTLTHPRQLNECCTAWMIDEYVYWSGASSLQSNPESEYKCYNVPTAQCFPILEYAYSGESEVLRLTNGRDCPNSSEELHQLVVVTSHLDGTLKTGVDYSVSRRSVD